MKRTLKEQLEQVPEWLIYLVWFLASADLVIMVDVIVVILLVFVGFMFLGILDSFYGL